MSDPKLGPFCQPLILADGPIRPIRYTKAFTAVGRSVVGFEADEEAAPIRRQESSLVGPCLIDDQS